MHSGALSILINMLKDFEKLFARLDSLEMPAGLFEKIMNRIHKERRQRARCRFFIFSASLVMSLAAMVSAFATAKTAFAESGFLRFFSLLFSDFGVVASDWRNFGAVILETLPVASTVYIFAVLFWFLGSTRSLIKNIKTT